jgi:hypothetical protein
MAEGVTWLGGLFFILSIILFAAAYYMQSYGLGLFGLASMMIAAILFLYVGTEG